MLFSRLYQDIFQESTPMIFTRTSLPPLVGIIGVLLVLLSMPVFAQGFSSVTDISAHDAFLALQDEALILVDVRTEGEWNQTGVAQGAMPISMLDPEFLTKLALLTEENPDNPVAFICASGRRSGIVQAELMRMGHQNVFSVFGGTTGSSQALGWIGEGLPIVPWSGN